MSWCEENLQLECIWLQCLTHWDKHSCISSTNVCLDYTLCKSEHKKPQKRARSKNNNRTTHQFGQGGHHVITRFVGACIHAVASDLANFLNATATGAVRVTLRAVGKKWDNSEDKYKNDSKYVATKNWKNCNGLQLSFASQLTKIWIAL